MTPVIGPQFALVELSRLRIPPFMFYLTNRSVGSVSKLCRRIVLLLAVLVWPNVVRGVSASSDSAKPRPVPAPVSSAITESCIFCHEGPDAEGGFDLASLSGDLTNPAVMKRWMRVHDRTKSGEMPPPDMELDPEARAAVVKNTDRWIRTFERQVDSFYGRVRGRQLSHIQLERTLQDLLCIDRKLSRMLPADTRTHGFYGIAEGQSVSHYQIQSHLRLVDAALDAAADRLIGGRPKTLELDAKGIARKNPKSRNREPELRKGYALVWASQMAYYGRISPTRAPETGWYRITVKASAENKPKDHGVWCSVRSGLCVSSAPQLHWIGSFEAQNPAKQWTFEAYIEKDHVLEIRPADRTLKQGRFQGGQVGAGEGDGQNLSGVNLHSLRIERIYPEGDDDAARKALFGDLDIKLDHKPTRVRLPAAKSGQLINQLRVFASRAFRRPVSEDDLRPYVEMLRRDLRSDVPKVEALRNAYRTVLCSPRFLYHIEGQSNGRLDDHSIANRLSYFLTGGPPDEELRLAADEGLLIDDREILSQANRLLDGEGLDRFVDDFADQWLDLIDIDFTDPDNRLFPAFDTIVQNAMLEETRQTVRKLMADNAPARKLIDPRFTYLNSRLARFYGMPDKAKGEMALVKLDAGNVRGGLLGQGAIQKVTANGTDTSPVLRGVWISEKIFGYEIPPPPENVPAIEPDIRGAKTIREQLSKHTSSEQCAACHKVIDPSGYALENFDPSGSWRDRYVTARNRRSPKKQPPVDASFKMPNGKPFDDYLEFRSMVAKDQSRLARAFAGHLLTYATGASVRYSDRDDLDRIVEQTKAGQYRLRDILDSVVTSPLFVTK
ncbi:MAG: DUF1592 domain-containing protein [Planctomycetota bacterium]